MNKILVCFFTFFTVSIFAQVFSPNSIIKQEFDLEKTNVFNDNNNWIFVSKVYSENSLKKKVYTLTDSLKINDLFSKYSSIEKLKYEYYICDFYTFEEHFGLRLNKTIVTDEKYLTNFSVIKYKTFNYAVEINSVFDCDNKDVNLKNIVYTFSLGKGMIVVEFDEAFFYSSIFNKDCNLIERIKFEKSNFYFLNSDKYFILKTNKYLILYTI